MSARAQQILRRAFMATMQDPDFLAEAQKTRVDIIFNLEPALVAKLKEILR